MFHVKHHSRFKVLKMEELIIVNGTQLANKELEKKVRVIIDADRKLKSAQWDITYALTDILYDGLWEDDFDTQKDFATFVGLSPASISQYKGARIFKDIVEDSEDITVANAYLLYTLFEIVEDSTGTQYNTSKFIEFCEWAINHNYDLKHITQKALRTIIAEFLKPEAEEVEAEEIEAEEVEAEEVEAEEITALEKAKALVSTMTSEEILELVNYINTLNK